MTSSGADSIVGGVARRVSFASDYLVVELADGRVLHVPVSWYPRLVHGTQAERGHCEIIANGEGIHWPDLDEDLSVDGLLAGRRSGESPKSFDRWLQARAGSGRH
jgi:hypothetical protein